MCKHQCFTLSCGISQLSSIGHQNVYSTENHVNLLCEHGDMLVFQQTTKSNKLQHTS